MAITTCPARQLVDPGPAAGARADPWSIPERKGGALRQMTTGRSPVGPAERGMAEIQPAIGSFMLRRLDGGHPHGRCSAREPIGHLRRMRINRPCGVRSVRARNLDTSADVLDVSGLPSRRRGTGGTDHSRASPRRSRRRHLSAGELGLVIPRQRQAGIRVARCRAAAARLKAWASSRQWSLGCE